MTVLDHGIHARPHYHLRLFFAIMAVAGVILFWAVGPISTDAPKAVAVSVENPCVNDAPGCEMLWLQKNLTDMEQPILLLDPEIR